jgi:hypothetical protein
MLGQVWLGVMRCCIKAIPKKFWVILPNFGQTFFG